MKKLVNHVDHVVWLSRFENVEENVSLMEKMSGIKFEYLKNPRSGIVVYMSWEAGLEIIAPLPERTQFNEALHKKLETQGEGVHAVVFGVKDIEEQETRLKDEGINLGSRMALSSDAPWAHKVSIHERPGPTILNTMFALGEIAYAEGVVSFEDA